MTQTVQSRDPRTGEVVGEVAPEMSAADVRAICQRAADAAGALERMDREGRARLLRAMADALETDSATLIAIADRETALGSTRLTGELARTAYQLRLFAEVLEEGSYIEATIDHAGDTPMGPRPDLRRLLIALGPVAVFGASNFPFAFSVPGGDTASALAAGCPVVVKAHPSHPATSQAAYASLARAAAEVGAPDGTIQIVHGTEAGGTLVRDPAVRAVGFTGSTRGGRALFDIAQGRPEPIPFYGELGSLNTLIVTPTAARERAHDIATGYVGSVTLGHGQFCTKPGLAFIPSGDDSKELRAALADAANATSPGWMLDGRIRDAYVDGVRRLTGLPGVEVLGGAPDQPATGASTEPGFSASPVLLGVSASTLIAAASSEELAPLLEDCFGPTALVVEYDDEAELFAALAVTEPTLAAAVHTAEDESELPGRLLPVLAHRTGRVVWNAYPTGVAVSWAIHHGGPWPATTNPLHTSVGATSIRRWVRPIAFQSVPQELLPPELRDGNPAGIPQRVDGTLVVPGT